MQRQLVVVLLAILVGLNTLLAYSVVTNRDANSYEKLSSELKSTQNKLASYDAQLKAIDTRVASLANVLPSDPNATPIAFSKTFTFWVPTFADTSRREPDAVEAEKKFHAWLGSKFGGWSRWNVQGGEASGEPEEGWFYQVSVPKGGIDVSSSQMKDDILRHFDQRSIYIIENRHR